METVSDLLILGSSVRRVQYSNQGGVTMGRSGVFFAETQAEKEAVYRFRYKIYVTEMGRYASVADHERKMLFEPEDATARIAYALKDDEVVATSCLSWGGDAPFSRDQVELYMLEPFIAEVPLEAMAIADHAMITPELRGSELFDALNGALMNFVNDKRIQLIFGACEPHLLSGYVARGMRTYSSKNINGPEDGFLIPVVYVVEDVAYLRRIGSPAALSARDYGDDARIPSCVERLIERGGNVMSQRLVGSRAYYGEIHEALDAIADNRISALDELDEDEMVRVLGKSNIIECRAGDRVLKKGGVARNFFVVLEGNLEARDGDRMLRVMPAGDVFGEIAFLLERPRSADVYAATDARILSLSEGTLREVIAREPNVAGKLLLNVCKILAMRLTTG